MTDFCKEVSCEIPQLVMSQDREGSFRTIQGMVDVKVSPHSHLDGSRSGSHPYLRQSASRKASLCNTKPWELIGKPVSQFDAPFSLVSSTDLLSVSDSLIFCISSSACSRLFFFILDFNLLCSDSASMQHSNFCLIINSTSGLVTSIEASYWSPDVRVGLMIP